MPLFIQHIISKFSKNNLLIIVLLLLAFSANAQSNKKDKLQNQYKQIQAEIKKIESLISSTQNEKTNSLAQLNSISSKIGVRRNLIDNISNQISFLENSILEKQNVIISLEKDIKRLKDDYAKMVQNSYNNKYKTDPLNFIFSAENFNQMMQRFTYLRSYAKTRQNQSTLINRTIEDLNIKIAKLEEDKIEKTAFLSEEEKQKQELEKEKQIKNSLIAKLQKDESSLLKQIKEKNKAAQALNKEIEKIIAEEIRLAKAKAAKDAKAKGTTVSKGLALTPEEKALSDNFVSNRGKLPWPVSKGFIISQFGNHEHPTIKNVYTNNNGIDIKTETDANVRVVFGGTVVNSFYLDASQNSVIIKHGEYYSVYSNLKTVNVNAGDKLSTKQTIGTVSTQDGLSKVHLEIWKGTEKTNPELWLAK